MLEHILVKLPDGKCKNILSTDDIKLIQIILFKGQYGIRVYYKDKKRCITR